MGQQVPDPEKARSVRLNGCKRILKPLSLRSGLYPTTSGRPPSIWGPSILSATGSRPSGRPPSRRPGPSGRSGQPVFLQRNAIPRLGARHLFSVQCNPERREAPGTAVQAHPDARVNPYFCSAMQSRTSGSPRFLQIQGNMSLGKPLRSAPHQKSSSVHPAQSVLFALTIGRKGSQ